MLISPLQRLMGQLSNIDRHRSQPKWPFTQPRRPSFIRPQDRLDVYLADCAERGVNPQKPASGKVMLRHAAATIAAQAAGKSLNQWPDEVFERAAHS